MASGLSSSGLPYGVWFVVLWFAVWRLVCRPLVCRNSPQKKKNLIPLALFLLQTKNELDVEEPDGDAVGGHPFLNG
jgi:hypothetical protein